MARSAGPSAPDTAACIPPGRCYTDNLDRWQRFGCKRSDWRVCSSGRHLPRRPKDRPLDRSIAAGRSPEGRSPGGKTANHVRVYRRRAPGPTRSRPPPGWRRWRQTEQLLRSIPSTTNIFFGFHGYQWWMLLTYLHGSFSWRGKLLWNVLDLDKTRALNTKLYRIRSLNRHYDFERTNYTITSTTSSFSQKNTEETSALIT